MKPVEDYSRVEVNGVILNQRTLTMLQYAQQIYGGKIDLANRAITQGSYTSAEPASFGTHDYGGAVDFSVRVVPGGAILYHEIEPAIRALRAAGFARHSHTHQYRSSHCSSIPHALSHNRTNCPANTYN